MLDSTNIRLDIAQEKSSELEGKAIEPIQNEPHRKKTKKIKRASVSYRKTSDSLIYG